jgi:UDPglucose 6-dehydrogenase
MEMSVGVIGYGFVGKAVVHGFMNNCDVKINDPLHKDDPMYASLESIVENCPFIFLCLPTPMTRALGGEIDTSIMEEVLADISRIQRERAVHPVVVIKSTVLPEKLKYFEEFYANLDIVMNPEFLTEANYLDDFINMKNLVVGANRETSRDSVVNLYLYWSSCTKGYSVHVSDLQSAAMTKYMINCFLATKVIFMNQMKDIFKSSNPDGDWDKLVEMFHADGRTGDSHGMVPGPDGMHGFGLSCFPKDLNALTNYADSAGVDAELLKTVWAINLSIREEFDWSTMGKAVSG